MDSPSKTSQRNSRHYDFVLDAWQLIYGNNFHAGYFHRADESFKEATENLTGLLAGLGTFSEKSRVLDVGCGIGGPATFLYERYGCHVQGISTSEREILKARELAKHKGCDSHLTFAVADAKDNKLPDLSFDIVWAMESFHLIDNKTKAFAECARVLKNGGQLLLCDNMSGRALSDAEIVKYYQELRLLERVFGKTRTEPLSGYESAASKAGFTEVVCRDISRQTMPPTIEYFSRRLKAHYQELGDRSSKQYVDDFLNMCDIYLHFNAMGIMSYGLLKAIKPHAKPGRGFLS